MISQLGEKQPKIHNSCFVAQTACVIGDVILNEQSNIWFNTVLRGDADTISVGKYTNIQDGCVVHADKNKKVIIGEYVTIGHNVTIHACKIKNNVLIGMGAIVLDDAEIGENCIIAAGTLIPPGKKISGNSLVMGNPYKIKRELLEEEIKSIRQSAIDYAEKYSSLYK